MTWPPDRTMQTLAVLTHRPRLALFPDGRLFAELGGSDVWEVEIGETDELARRGWIADAADGVVAVTEGGRYWARRWVNGPGKQYGLILGDA